MYVRYQNGYSTVPFLTRATFLVEDKLNLSYLSIWAGSGAGRPKREERMGMGIVRQTPRSCKKCVALGTHKVVVIMPCCSLSRPAGLHPHVWERAALARKLEISGSKSGGRHLVTPLCDFWLAAALFACVLALQRFIGGGFGSTCDGWTCVCSASGIIMV